MLRVAVVGAGGMGSVHIQNWKKMKDVKLVVCDIRLNLAKEKVSDIYGTAYDDIDVMLESENFDIVDICTPTYLHKEHALKAISKKINVLVEKPIALCEQDAKEIFDAANSCGVKIMVAHVIRFWNEYLILKNIYENNIYGNIINASFWRLSLVPTWSYNDWMLDEKLSGLVPLDLHIHDLDYIIDLFGIPNEKIVFRGKPEKKSYQDHYQVIYKYDKFFINCEAAWYDNQFPFSAGFRFHFEKAVIEYKDGTMKAYVDNGEVLILNNLITKDETGINIPSTDAYFNEIDYFAKCVIKNKIIEKVPQEDVLSVLKLLSE